VRRSSPRNKSKPMAPSAPIEAGVEHLSLDSSRRVQDHYELGKVIGEGAYGKVRLAHAKDDPSQEVAVKVLKRPPPEQMAKLVQEVRIMQRLEHPNVVAVMDVFLTEHFVYIVMEFVAGGELFDAIVNRGSYTENDARQVTRTLCETIAFCHEKGVAHRDLKPDNILLKATSGSPSDIKIADFGLSKTAGDGGFEAHMMRTACGTPGYVAPEVITRQPYDTQVDMWSLGVIVYVLLAGRLPFDGANDTEVCDKTVRGKLQFFSPYWDAISAEAKDFVSHLLTRNPAKRLTAAQALAHPWLEATMRHRDSVDLFRKPTTRALPPLQFFGAPLGHHASNTTMKQVFMEYNMDRQAVKLALVRSMFGLAEEEVIVEKFKCYDGAGYRPSRLYVTTLHVCLLAHSGEKHSISISNLAVVTKAKR